MPICADLSRTSSTSTISAKSEKGYLRYALLVSMPVSFVLSVHTYTTYVFAELTPAQRPTLPPDSVCFSSFLICSQSELVGSHAVGQQCSGSPTKKSPVQGMGM